jgi:hypothetical protein
LGRDRLVLVLAAPLGLGRSSDCKRRHGGDQDRPGHHLNSAFWISLHFGENRLITT